jgi:hypothetical protein
MTPMGADDRREASPAGETATPLVVAPTGDREPIAGAVAGVPGLGRGGVVDALANAGLEQRAWVMLAMQQTCGNQQVARLVQRQRTPVAHDEPPTGPIMHWHPSPVMVSRGAKGAAAKKVVGWVVTVGERKLIKRAAIYTEKEMAKLLAKGYNILVRSGDHVAKRVAKKVWKDYLHHTGHIIRKTGKLGLPHYQPFRQIVGRASEKGWHIFYSALPVLFFSEDAEAMAIYEDKYPGESFANYLTVTHYSGEDSWLSYLDWVNPLELIAIGGDMGRNWDRERTKELKAIVLNRVAKDGSRQTYELDAEGRLARVIVVSTQGHQKEFTAEQFYEFLGENAKATEDVPAEDGTKHKNFASTFDAEYRIYGSKTGWEYDAKTASFYLPEPDARRLIRIGEFWVMEDRNLDYVYAYAHPRHRAMLRQPGFTVPKDMTEEYFDSPDKAAYLTRWFEMQIAGAAIRDVKIRVPTAAGDSENRTPIKAGGSGERTPINAGGSEQRTPINAGGS